MSWTELGLPFGIFLLWFVLARWVLPWFGVPTCMSGACGADRHAAGSEEPLELVGGMRGCHTTPLAAQQEGEIQ
jgi:hypothetical protein